LEILGGNNKPKLSKVMKNRKYPQTKSAEENVRITVCSLSI
jgi:hypothetical protein